MTLSTLDSQADSVGDSTVVTVKKGIPGFPELSSLEIVPIDADAMFVWLSEAGSDAVAFLAVNPFIYFADYDVALTPLEENALSFAPGDELIVYCLVTIDRDAGSASANLMAPLVINMSRRIAQQVILEGEHDLRAPLPAPDWENTK